MYCNDINVVRGIYPTNDFLDFCVPDMQKTREERPEVYDQFMTTFYKLMASNPAGRVVQDVWVSSKIILSCVPLSFIYCVLYVYAMSKMADVIAWFIIVMVEIGFILGALFCFWEFSNHDQRYLQVNN